MSHGRMANGELERNRYSLDSYNRIVECLLRDRPPTYSVDQDKPPTYEESCDGRTEHHRRPSMSDEQRVSYYEFN